MQPQHGTGQKPRVADVNTCANPSCDRQFLRMGEGYLSVFPISDPALWGLPLHVKQKVVWICDKCSVNYYVRLDRRNHSVRLVHRPPKTARAA